MMKYTGSRVPAENSLWYMRHILTPLPMAVQYQNNMLHHASIPASKVVTAPFWIQDISSICATSLCTESLHFFSSHVVQTHGRCIYVDGHAENDVHSAITIDVNEAYARFGSCAKYQLTPIHRLNIVNANTVKASYWIIVVTLRCHKMHRSSGLEGNCCNQ